MVCHSRSEHYKDISEGFRIRLKFNCNELLDITKKLGTPVYVYDGRIIVDNAKRLKAAFSDFSFYYSIKANPNLNICKELAQLGFGGEAVSDGEIKVALASGFSPDKILFAGPGKTEAEIDFAIDSGVFIITAESIEQLELIEMVAKNKGRKVKTLLRLNVEGLKFESCEHMMGSSSQFGMDIQTIINAKQLIEKLKNTTVIGIQCYAGSQILDPTYLPKVIQHQIIIADHLKSIVSIGTEVLDFGGGFGIPYGDEQLPFDLNTCGELARFQIRHANLDPRSRTLILESGRFLVGNGGAFLTKIIDIKETYGERFIICDGGMNCFTRPILVRSPHKIGTLSPKSQISDSSFYSICGPSCSSMDCLGKVYLSNPKIGDIIAVYDSGAYGWSMSLHSFHSKNPPKEVYLCPDRVCEYEDTII